MSRKDLTLRFRQLISDGDYTFKEDYDEIVALWQDYLGFMLELGRISKPKYQTLLSHY